MTSTDNTPFKKTTKNGVTIAMRGFAPDHVARIKELVRGPLRRHRFHQVIDGFMAQTGPAGHRHQRFGQSSRLNLTRKARARHRFDGARRQPDSGDSQFFICLLTRRFSTANTVWGAITDGMENVDKIKRGEPVISRTKSGKPRSSRECAEAGRQTWGQHPRAVYLLFRLPHAHRSVDSSFRQTHCVRPAEPRDDARLLSCVRQACGTDDRTVADLPACWRRAIRSWSTTPVIAASLTAGACLGRRPKIEATLIKRLDGSRWRTPPNRP